MTRLARIVVPGLPHHVTARGNRREPIFFEDGDQEIYLDLLAEHTRKARVAVWSYCLMPNHVHLILTPVDEAGLARAVGETHRRYTNFINARGHPPPLGVACEARGGDAQSASWGAGICFRSGSAQWSWTTRTWPRPFSMLR